VDGIEAFHERCVANGVTILRPLTPTAWGTKDFYIEDPDGHIIAFGGRPSAHGASPEHPAPERPPQHISPSGFGLLGW
jgi:hypothetical protein